MADLLAFDATKSEEENIQKVVIILCSGWHNSWRRMGNIPCFVWIPLGHQSCGCKVGC